MSHFAWILLLMSTGPVYAQTDGDRSSIGEQKPLSEAVKVEEEQQPAFEQPVTKPVVDQEGEAERPNLPDSAPQSDRL